MMQTKAGEFVEVGGLMSYATSLADLYRRAATYVKARAGRAVWGIVVQDATGVGQHKQGGDVKRKEIGIMRR